MFFLSERKTQNILQTHGDRMSGGVELDARKINLFAVSVLFELAFIWLEP